MSDSEYMALALRLAQRGLFTSAPNPRVGCVLVKNQKILAQGWHQWAGQAHAEVHALSQLPDEQAACGATAYVTLEPCSHTGRTGPCCDALIKAGVERVVVAAQDPNPLVAGRGLQRLRDAGVQVECGLMQAAAIDINRGFIKRMLQGIPWISSKLAMSLDGRTAMANGESQWITSPQARADVHRQRAACDAVLTGIDTVLSDNPRLDARVDYECKAPVKVVLDSRLRLPVSAQLLTTPGETWVVTCVQDRRKHQALLDAGCKIFCVAQNNGHVDLAQAFQCLAQQQINYVWVEAGAVLNGALLEQGWVDDWQIYMATSILGDQGRGLFHLPGLQYMADKKNLRLLDVRRVGPDLRLSLVRG
jgi:diaminohydroxyphosphoribosylaminopyrimidine deaminase / 5-amino-6-(5-phosphoribosylamino)uracil reductase